jgi:hypothetical protein
MGKSKTVFALLKRCTKDGVGQSSFWIWAKGGIKIFFDRCNFIEKDYTGTALVAQSKSMDYSM